MAPPAWLLDLPLACSATAARQATISKPLSIYMSFGNIYLYFIVSSGFALDAYRCLTDLQRQSVAYLYAHSYIWAL